MIKWSRCRFPFYFTGMKDNRMNFNIGDTVIKPGLGICKIKAIKKMQVEGKEQQFYVLQSGDVKVLVPFSYAHSGGLRSILDEEGIEKVMEFLRLPIPLPEDESDSLETYMVNIEQSKEEIKQRDPLTVSMISKKLFYKSKIADLPKAEAELLQNSLTAVSEEIAQVQHTTRQKVLFKIRSLLSEGRKSRKQHY